MKHDDENPFANPAFKEAYDNHVKQVEARQHLIDCGEGLSRWRSKNPPRETFSAKPPEEFLLDFRAAEEARREAEEARHRAEHAAHGSEGLGGQRGVSRG